MSSAAGTTILQNDGSVTLAEDGGRLLSDGLSDCDCCGHPCISSVASGAATYNIVPPGTINWGSCAVPQSCSPNTSPVLLSADGLGGWRATVACVSGGTIYLISMAAVADVDGCLYWLARFEFIRDDGSHCYLDYTRYIADSAEEPIGLLDLAGIFNGDGTPCTSASADAQVAVTA